MVTSTNKADSGDRIWHHECKEGKSYTMEELFERLKRTGKEAKLSVSAISNEDENVQEKLYQGKSSKANFLFHAIIFGIVTLYINNNNLVTLKFVNF